MSALTKSSKIFITGHLGMVGSAIYNLLQKNGYRNIVVASKSELDLRNQAKVAKFFQKEQPDIVINAAARVGGIMANLEEPYQFLMDNLKIQNNVIHEAYNSGVEKFIFLGSSCIYPRLAKQPITESELLQSALESTNEGYALAKITGVKACEYLKKKHKKAFYSLMPTNLYGFHDNFNPNTSHVIPALIFKFHQAKLNQSNLTLWGTGNALREFLFVNDFAEAILFALENKLKEPYYNVGYAKEISILELANLISKIVGYKGNIVWDSSKPDGTPRKLLDSSSFRQLGWKPKTSLEEGLSKTYQWFLKNHN